MKSPEIIWSPFAEESYLRTLTYILENWSLKEAEDFESKVESLLHRLINHQHLCPTSKLQESLRRCVISSQTSLIYQINGNRNIELVAFFDNRSDHKY